MIRKDQAVLIATEFIQASSVPCGEMIGVRRIAGQKEAWWVVFFNLMHEALVEEDGSVFLEDADRFVCVKVYEVSGKASFVNFL